MFQIQQCQFQIQNVPATVTAIAVCVRTWLTIFEAACTWLFDIGSGLCLPSPLHYSGISIYHSRSDRFPACTIRHFCSRMKFHINNVIYSRIHCSLDYRFTALIVCKSRSQRSISRMDRLKKKFEAKYLLFALPSLWTINLATQ